MAARSHSMSSKTVSRWLIYDIESSLTLIEICLVEILGPGDVHVVETCDLVRVSQGIPTVPVVSRCDGLESAEAA